MLALIDTPAALDDLDKQCRKLARELHKAWPEAGEKRILSQHVDLLREFPSTWIFIHKGVFQFLDRDKNVRFYSQGDWLPAFPASDNVRVISEFGSEIEIFGEQSVAATLSSQPALIAQWLRYQAMQERIAHMLCALHMPAPVQCAVRIQPFSAGELIFKEGDEPTGIYEMVQGEADVTAKGHLISAIGERQIFGELSFFMGTHRNATVTAKTDCLVQIIEQKDFLALMQRRPSMVNNVIHTLCARLLEVDRQLIGN